MDKETFGLEVIAKSQRIPVVVDFWAPWCGPCKILGPVIEELAEEANGNWQLVKVNVDESREISTEFNIMSIPTVMLFHQGKKVDEFAGSLPKFQIQQWLVDRLPDERKNELNEIYARIQGGMYDKAKAELEVFVEKYPDLLEAKVWLAAQIVGEDVNRAKSLVEEIKIGHKLYEDAEDIRNLVAWMNCEDDSIKSLYDKITQAKTSYKNYDWDNALDLLIQSILIDKSYCNEIARRAAIAIFHQLGEGHEITKKYRPRFNMALY